MNQEVAIDCIMSKVSVRCYCPTDGAVTLRVLRNAKALDHQYD
jgi:hypothetical protein